MPRSAPFGGSAGASLAASCGLRTHRRSRSCSPKSRENSDLTLLDLTPRSEPPLGSRTPRVHPEQGRGKRPRRSARRPAPPRWAVACDEVKRVARVCVFCGRTDLNLEDAWPRWLSRTSSPEETNSLTVSTTRTQNFDTAFLVLRHLSPRTAKKLAIFQSPNSASGFMPPVKSNATEAG